MATGPLAPLVLFLAWVVFALYSVSILSWLVQVFVLGRDQLVTDEELVYDHEDVQVRILTIGAEAVVQATVDSIPEAVDDVHVIAERDIEIDGATVHVVPEEFECAARHKGRALEWARQTVPCSREFVLYLDEDTIVQNFQGLPDADIVQITEKPLYTGSLLAFLSETFRIGYQYEQRSFGWFTYPLYAWGGGIAIRKSLEDELTWDAETITEDTNFVWRAAESRDLDFRVLNLKFRNQAPPSVRGMFRQRRRWFAGTQSSADLLPRRYRLLFAFRMFTWALSPLIPLLSLVLFAFPQFVPEPAYYQIGSLALFGTLFFITFLGTLVYLPRERVTLLAIPLTPLVVVLNTAGALWALISPVHTFAVTEKVAPVTEHVDPATIERVHPKLAEGQLSEHDGVGRLISDGGVDLDDTAQPDGQD